MSLRSEDEEDDFPPAINLFIICFLVVVVLVEVILVCFWIWSLAGMS
jgi:hypothetical protein